MMLTEITRSQVAMATLVVHGKEGCHVYVADADGQAVSGVFYADGLRPMKELLPIVPEGGRVVVETQRGEFYVPGGRQAVVSHPMHRHSGANPLFQPRSRYDPTLQMEAAVKKLEKRANALVKREKALMAALEQRLSEVPNAQAQEPAEPVVVESQETGETGSAAE